MQRRFALACQDCETKMSWHARRQIEVGETKRLFDIFQCDTCGRFSWADLEPRARQTHQTQQSVSIQP
jgi:uncharacterized protein with PIN domain